jgi:hypothetical protein
MRIDVALQVTSLSFSPENRVQRGSDEQPFAEPRGRHPFGAPNRLYVKDRIHRLEPRLEES